MSNTTKTTYLVTTATLKIAAENLSANFGGMKAKTLLQRRKAFNAIGVAGKAAKVALLIRELGEGEHTPETIMAVALHGFNGDKAGFIAAWEARNTAEDCQSGGAAYTAYNKLARQVAATIATGEMQAGMKGQSWHIAKGAFGKRTVKPKQLPEGKASGVESVGTPQALPLTQAERAEARKHEATPPTLPRIKPLSETQRAAYVDNIPKGCGHIISATQIALSIDKAGSEAAYNHMTSDIIDLLIKAHESITG